MLAVAGLLLPPSAGAFTEPAEGYKNAVVAADHPLASAAGLEVLRQGGNAVDAACATAFALGVVNPSGSGIGGGGFLMLLRAGDKEPQVLDFRETAPAAADRAMFLKPGLPSDASRVGGLAVAVPGEVAGCAQAVAEFGELPLRKVLAPAIRLAERGFAVGPHLAATTRDQQKALAAHPALARIFLPGGKPLEVGQVLRRPLLARSLKALASQGPAVFYKGWISEEIVKAVQAAGGVMTAADLAGYRVKRRTALRTTYRGNTAFCMPPPSSGGVALIEALNILERFPLGAMGHNSSMYLHHLAEALKHAFADRARHLGDADFVKVPVERLTSRAYADTLGAAIRNKVRSSKRYGSPTERPKAPSTERGGTSHISVVDARGNAASMTTTINTSFGSLLVAGSSGVVLNNEMDDFAASPGKSNAFGLVQGEGNAVAAGKRPLSSMSPTIVLDSKGKLRLVAGASGGPTIISGTLQALLNVIDFGLDAAAAVSRSRIHHQWIPNQMKVEDDLPGDVVFGLARRGHLLKLQEHPFTAVQVVVVDPQGLRYGASDPRKMGAPAGY